MLYCSLLAVSAGLDLHELPHRALQLPLLLLPAASRARLLLHIAETGPGHMGHGGQLLLYCTVLYCTGTVLYCTVLYCTILWILSTSHCTLLYFLSPCPLLRPLVCWPDILRLQTELCFTRLWRRWLVTAWLQAPGCPYIYIALVQFSQFTFVFDFETMIDDIWLSKIFGLPKALDPRRLKL